jgi:hypothetical protein
MHRYRHPISPPRPSSYGTIPPYIGREMVGKLVPLPLLPWRTKPCSGFAWCIAIVAVFCPLYIYASWFLLPKPRFEEPPWGSMRIHIDVTSTEFGIFRMWDQDATSTIAKGMAVRRLKIQHAFGWEGSFALSEPIKILATRER